MTRKRFNRGSKRTTRGYKSKTQIIAHNEARSVVKRALTTTIEHKRYDGQQVYINMPTAGSVVSLFTDPNSSTGQGEDVGAVGTIGATIKPTSVRIRYGINTNGTPANALARVLVIQQRGQGVPSIADLLQSAVDTVLSGYDIVNVGTTGSRGDLRILYDKVINVNVNSDSVKFRTIYIPGRKLRHIRFFPASPNAITDGNIYIVFMSDNGVSPARIKYYSMIEYMDA